MNTFPKIYVNQPDPTGIQWLEKFAILKATCEAGGIAAVFGANGTGKTRMAYEVAKTGAFPNIATMKVTRGDFTDRNPAIPIYSTAMGVFLKLRDCYGTKAEMSEMKAINEFAAASLLVIDEMQERGETRFEDQRLTHIVDLRYQSGRPTILISNLPLDKFAGSMSPSILSRITERGKFISCDWESYRKPNL